MRTLSRMTALLACLAVLLVALPAHAATAPPSHSSQDSTVAQWLGSVLADLAHFAVRPSVPPGKGHTTLRPKGGSCIDPNGYPTLCFAGINLLGH
ncbi:MAG TPA: hypothetical protein VFE33_01990 [Thermoanaerobaculia bacterium]|nr:hypothetical protein [Thermoanaerobaculia bacterium]